MLPLEVSTVSLKLFLQKSGSFSQPKLPLHPSASVIKTTREGEN